MSAHSDLDLLVVGDHEIKDLQREICREINSVNMSEDEFKKRINVKDPFVTGIMQDKAIRLV